MMPTYPSCINRGAASLDAVRARFKKALMDCLNHIRSTLDQNVRAILAAAVIALHCQVELVNAGTHRAVKHQYAAIEFSYKSISHNAFCISGGPTATRLNWFRGR